LTEDLSNADEIAKKDRRRSSRVLAPTIEILCDGDMYVVHNWGIGGCQFSNYTGYLRPDDLLMLELYLLGFREFESLSIKAKVLRYDPENENTLALQFLDLSAQTILDYCDSVEKSGGDQVSKASA